MLLTLLAEGSYVARSDLTVAGFLQEGHETMQAQLRESTWYSYGIVVDRLIRQVGGVQLQALTPMQLETASAGSTSRTGSRSFAHERPVRCSRSTTSRQTVTRCSGWPTA